MKRCFIPYTHFCAPSMLKSHKGFDEITWLVEFTHQGILKRFGRSDWDKDWRKLLGVKAKLFDPHWNTAMVGFRPDIDGSDRLELNAYYHADGSVRKTPAIAKVGLNEKTYIRFSRWEGVEETTITIQIFDRHRNLVADSEMMFNYAGQSWWEVNPWYGGQATARSGMCFWLERVENFDQK